MTSNQHAPTRPITLAISMLSMLVATTVGCSNEAATKADCGEICDRYKDCFDRSFDADTCQDRCVDNADSAQQQDRVDQCAACIDEDSCSGAAFSCSDECLGIVS